MKKRSWITLAVIIAMIILAIFLVNASKNGVSKETAICIGENSELYTQFGCHACEIQKDMFGTSYKYLNVTDCFYNMEKCSLVTHTPTWIINGEKYRGVQNLEKLKELTGCT